MILWTPKEVIRGRIFWGVGAPCLVEVPVFRMVIFVYLSNSNDWTISKYYVIARLPKYCGLDECTILKWNELDRIFKWTKKLKCFKRMNKFKWINGRTNYLSHDKRACQVSSNPNVGGPSQDLAQQVSGQRKLIGWAGLLGGSLRKPVLPWAHLKNKLLNEWRMK